MLTSRATQPIVSPWHHRDPQVSRRDAASEDSPGRELRRRAQAALFRHDGDDVRGARARSRDPVGSDLPVHLEATIFRTRAAADLSPTRSSLEGTQTGDEGCLSFPGIFLPVKRALRCTARAHDLDGRELLATAEGLYARAIQHEIDHLDGKLLVDYAGPVKRRMIKRYMDRREWEVEGQNIRGELDDSPL